MDRTERFHKIENRLRQQASVSFAQLQSELEVSVATLKRDLRYLRDRFDEPIVWDPQTRGYRWRNAGQQPRLPGPWYSASEIHAILTLEQLLAQLDPAGVLAQQVAPLRSGCSGCWKDRAKPPNCATACGSSAWPGARCRRRTSSRW